MKEKENRHNSSTRGVNTKKKGALWATRKALVKDKNTKEVKEVNVEVRVPPNSLYNPELLSMKNLPEPFDSIQLDWADELASYVADSSLKLYREALEDGLFEYKVCDERGNLIFSVISSRNAFIDSRPRRKRRRGRKKE